MRNFFCIPYLVPYRKESIQNFFCTLYFASFDAVCQFYKVSTTFRHTQKCLQLCLTSNGSWLLISNQIFEKYLQTGSSSVVEWIRPWVLSLIVDINNQLLSMVVSLWHDMLSQLYSWVRHFAGLSHSCFRFRKSF